MITDYYRPDRIDEALSLLKSADKKTIPLGGGLFINEVIQEDIAVVDLQNLGLNQILHKSKNIQLGAAVTLQTLLDVDDLQQGVVEAVKHQETYNRRQVATIAGTLVTATGRSPIGTVFLALDAVLELEAADEDQRQIHYGDLLPLREEKLEGKLISRVIIPSEVKLAYYYAARSPADLPIVAAAAARWTSGRTRVVIGGTGDQPLLVIDGQDEDGAAEAAVSAYSDAGDQWAGAEYRSQTAGALARRCVEDVLAQEKRDK